MTERIKGRIFLVGCPRSGTTLLQSLIAAHPQIASFPESHFFPAVGKKWRTTLGLASSKGFERKRLYRFLANIGRTDMKRLVPRYGILVRQYTNAFVNVLDTLTISQGKDFWLEKTPSHLHYIDVIEKYVPTARFIHILRNGLDVVASLYEVTHQHPHEWGGIYDIGRCIARWNKDVKLTQQYIHRENHTLVRYEQLIRNTDAVLTTVCGFIGIGFREDMVAQHSLAAERLILRQEPWTQQAMQEIHSAHKNKFDVLFNEQQRISILERLVHLPDDLSPIGGG
jgi:hypothetical protein